MRLLSLKKNTLYIHTPLDGGRRQISGGGCQSGGGDDVAQIRQHLPVPVQGQLGRQTAVRNHRRRTGSRQEFPLGRQVQLGHQHSISSRRRWGLLSPSSSSSQSPLHGLLLLLQRDFLLMMIMVVVVSVDHVDDLHGRGVADGGEKRSGRRGGILRYSPPGRRDGRREIHRSSHWGTGRRRRRTAQWGVLLKKKGGGEICRGLCLL